MKEPTVTFIIRTMNEAEKLYRLLTCLKSQEYGGEIEIIVVDNESTDESRKVAKEFGAKVLSISKKDFSFPRAMNVGAGKASGDILVFISSHALPVSERWLKSGIVHFADSEVGGVYSPTIPHNAPGYPKRTLAEIVFYYPGYLLARIRGPHCVTSARMGILGATNCAIRRSLWQEHNFDESFGAGGEDWEMAKWILKCRYKIIRDHRFAVYHSHGLGIRGMKEQFDYWARLAQPQKFKREKLFYRKDLKFS